MEHRITFSSEGTILEGMLENPGAKRGVVITHPHPLYGGDMDNPVVLAITESYRKAGFATLRFNFRGAGNSDGEFDEGYGAIRDLLAAVYRLKSEGMEEVTCSGYSFGTWICLSASLAHPVTTDVMVAPPVTFLDFQTSPCNRGPNLVISGTQDSFADFETVKGMVPVWNPDARLHVIESADHFFSIHLKEVSRAIDDYLAGL
ncbi:alpha/beta hydrolase [Desulfoluna spongiiphila]|uniref:Xaa-Pro dipeptidyl-peptidase-like domain-containing protein n=1 Tax=Desulfoluna spongiiphila TaxID=419481 RepID=A0A1G5AGS2_9BACT|nr:hypothetical protein [Desulfoluna spongiiphila]SCX77086.1 hypothetical protein SAMN05216233_101171 [Desulfoluna spongiiphila]VVS90601.1 alpha/beta hydrolase fold [Desulfoluna spongiiphila]